MIGLNLYRHKDDNALSAHNSGVSLVRRFVEVTHGNRAVCPHPRAAPNLTAVVLAAIDDHYRGTATPHQCTDAECEVLCFADMLEHMCEYEDWLAIVGGVLQPVPFCASAMMCPRIGPRLENVLSALSRDQRCIVHGCLAPAGAARPCPPSWLRAAAPSNPQLAIAQPAALESLCLMLEWEVVNGEQSQLEIIAALQGTELGKKYYLDLCDRQQTLEILLPSLRYLNLWCTKFGDQGVQLIAEHLPRLQVLNLCETPVSDKGVEALSGLSSLRRINLNSTKLSAEAFDNLRQHLPQLQEYDVRYTEAW
ncbi:unnamed protein product [Leptidea sinapis]|uniref:Uncharacterized protein n=1 Tax=Leptidea sinapis TaxID=189913 RepID=A0A5E4QHR9_9NEOP|nr:unnamed protein product [Leptidea sinapis]